MRMTKTNFGGYVRCLPRLADIEMRWQSHGFILWWAELVCMCVVLRVVRPVL